MPIPPVIDPAALARLRELGGPAFARKMIDLFLEVSPRRMAEARAALQAGDPAALARAVHPLRSSGANMGARRVQDLATLIDEQARRPVGPDFAPLLDELESALAEARLQLEKERDTLSP